MLQQRLLSAYVLLHVAAPTVPAGKLDLADPLLAKFLLFVIAFLISVLIAVVAFWLARRSTRPSIAARSAGGAFALTATLCILVIASFLP
ncbi:hypothetical protein [Lentzea sp. NPDC059081]|uniref:hypothetical protein n=1 Tax=Lentzea sp. NPDC059081 TaxID=3346719 RepID=UPI0036762788